MTNHRCLMTVLAVLALAAYGCGDDTNGDGSGSGGPGVVTGAEPKIEVTEGGVNANADDFVLSVSLSGFCTPEADEGCDLDDPSNNEKLAGSLKVINTGDRALEISEVSVASPTNAFRLEAQAPLELPKDGTNVSLFPTLGSSNPRTLWVDVYVLRQEEGAAAPSAVITIRSNSKINQAEVIQIPVETGGLVPEITVDPNAIDFGNVGADEIASKQLHVINSGLGTLELSGFVLSGHPAFAFAYGGQEWPVTAETQSQGITFDEVIEVDPGEAIQAMVRFQPEGPEPAQANLVLLSNDPTQAGGTLVKISGNQSGPCISINPKKVDFGGKLIGKVATVDVELLSCGESPVRLRGITLDETSSGDFGMDLGNLPGLDPGMGELVLDDTACTIDTDCAAGLVCDNGACSVEIGINQTATFQVTFTPDEINELGENGQPVPDLGMIHLLSNSFVSELDVEVRGFGVEVECPTSVILVQEGEEVIPQTKLHLIGSQSYAASGAIAKYEWSVQQPVGSQSIFLPSSAAADPTFEVNVAGTYVFTLRVWDENDEESCVPGTYTVYVNPDEAIHVELLWDTPNDPDQTDEGPEAGADLDLHFAHWFATGTDVDGDGEGDGWFDQPFDCFWFNDHPQWGSFDPMIDDDPGLDRDDTDGAGPENVNLNIPEDGGSYAVGVHYWNDHGFGPSLSTVRVYIYSQLVFEVAEVELVNHDLWEVVEIAWPSAQTTLITNNSGGYKIVPNYTTPFSMQ